MEYKKHNLILEFGEWVAYKSKRYKNLGHSIAVRAEGGKSPTEIERIPLGTASWEEACERLDCRLKPKEKPKYDPNHPKQTRLA